MKHLAGMNEQKWSKEGLASPVVLDTDKLINPHMLVAGMSGTGKSYQLRNFLSSCARERVQVDVFDVHEELDGLQNSASVKFSQATRIGFNPLVINLDPHSGGARNQVSSIVDMINRTSNKLGPRQETALRNLIGDVYYLRGIYPDEARSWVKRIITEEEHDNLTRARDYTALRNYYPILRDVISYGERKIKAMSIGGDSKSITSLERVEAAAAKLQSILTKFSRAGTDSEVEHLQSQLAKEKEKSIELYANYINSIESGREFGDIMKYSTRDTLISVVERLHSLQDSGIFCSNPPRFDDALIRVHQINALNNDQRALLFYNRANQILRESMDAGKSPTLRRIVMVDEGHLFYSEDSDNPMNRIAKEGRKFGLGLIVGSQSPTHFSEDFLSNCGVVFLMGIHEMYWDMACRKLRIDKTTLTSTRPQEVLALKMHMLGEAGARFQTVNVQASVVQQGLNALRGARAFG